MDLSNLHETWREAAALWCILRNIGYSPDDLYLRIGNYVGHGMCLGIELFPNDPFKFGIRVGPLPCPVEEVGETWAELFKEIQQLETEVLNQLVFGSLAYKGRVPLMIRMRDFGMPSPQDVAEFRRDPELHQSVKQFMAEMKNTPEIREFDSAVMQISRDLLTADKAEQNWG